MILFITTLIILIISFFVSYKNFKKEVHKTKKERVKSMQVFVLSWTLVVFIAITVYLLLCTYFGIDFFISI